MPAFLLFIVLYVCEIENNKVVPKIKIYETFPSRIYTIANNAEPKPIKY